MWWPNRQEKASNLTLGLDVPCVECGTVGFRINHGDDRGEVRPTMREIRRWASGGRVNGAVRCRNCNGRGFVAHA